MKQTRTAGGFLVAMKTNMVMWLVLGLLGAASSFSRADEVQRYLYVASPGIRNYLEFGGHGILVFDIDHGHTFVKRIPFDGLGQDGQPLNVKGICGHAEKQRLYVSTLEHLICLDLVRDNVIWQRRYEGGCDRMAISKDGSHLYLPTLEKDHWKVVAGDTGDELARIVTNSGAHNTVCGLDGRRAYLAGLRSPFLSVVDTRTYQVVQRIGPFSQSIRPFTVNGQQTRCIVTINDLLGFEIGDLTTGKRLHRVEVQGFEMGPVKRHGCPSHGVGLTPDEQQIWVTDGHNSRLHIFDATVSPPKQVDSIGLRDQPGWVTFSLDGTLAYPSTGEVIDVTSRKIIVALADEQGRWVQSEKMLEVHFHEGTPTRTGDQFGLGRVQ